MKSFIAFALLCCIAAAAQAQKFEISVNAGTGLYNYTGNGSNTSSLLLGSPSGTGNYINNPYGRKATFSYLANIQTKWITKSGFLFGVQAGYQFLRSKTYINRVYRNDLVYIAANPNYLILTYNGDPAHGSSVLTDQYIAVNPYVGYRFGLGKLSLDAMPGLDFDIPVYSKEKGQAVVDGNPPTTFRDDLKLNGLKSDLRFNFNLALNINRWGVTASYAKGLLNYDRNRVTITPYNGSSATNTEVKVYSQLFSTGLFYRIR